MRNTRGFILAPFLGAVLSCSSGDWNALAQDQCDPWIGPGAIASVAGSPAPVSPLQPVSGIFPDVRDARPLSFAEERTLIGLDHFKECDSCPEMVVIPVGDFIMGAPETEEGSSSEERRSIKLRSSGRLRPVSSIDGGNSTRRS